MSNFCTASYCLLLVCIIFATGNCITYYKWHELYNRETLVTALGMFAWEETTFIKCQGIKWKINAKNIPMKIRGFKEIFIYTDNKEFHKAQVYSSPSTVKSRKEYDGMSMWIGRENTKCIWNFGRRTTSSEVTRPSCRSEDNNEMDLGRQVTLM